MRYWRFNTDKDARNDVRTCDLWYEHGMAFTGDYEGTPESKRHYKHLAQLMKGDGVFMHHNGLGIVGYGLVNKPWNGKPYTGEERLLYREEIYEYRISVEWDPKCDCRHNPVSVQGLHYRPTSYPVNPETYPVQQLLSQLRMNAGVDEYPVNAYSWTFLSPTTSVKRMDKSSFLHRGTGIPKKYATLFGLPEDGLEAPRKITLHVDGTEFEGRFEMDAVRSRYRMFWLGNMAQQIQNRFPEYYNAFNSGQAFDGDAPTMIFEKLTDTNYAVTWESPVSGFRATDEKQTDWSDEELHAAVTAYFGMLKKESKGEPYSKTDVNNELRQDVLTQRSKGSVEFRMANISSVLDNLCHPTVKGYLPRGNVGNKVSDRIRRIIFDERLLDLDDYTPTADNEELNQRVSTLIKRGITGKPKGRMKPQRSEKSQSSYERDPLVKAWVINNAKGICELCGKPGPFEDKHGNLFLEEHHVVPLADGGPDTVENAVALCPNCHRKCHLSPEKLNIAMNLEKRIKRIDLPLLP